MNGLALAGGGVRGSYQMGAYLAFKKCHIKFDAITGTSIGSFNAAMLASNKEEELIQFWNTMDTSKIISISEEFKEEAIKKKISKKIITVGLNEAKKTIQNKGLDLTALKNELNRVFKEEDLRNSKIDFGLATFNMTTFKKVEVMKKDIPHGKVNEYIIASCYLPIFKREKIIDNSNYIDGGIIDVCPTDLLFNCGCDKVYAVLLNGIGRLKKDDRVTYIKPSRKLGSMLCLNPEIIRNNIELGFYDTYKVIKKLDGYNFYFKQRRNYFYDYLMKKVSKRKKIELQIFLKAKTNKEIVLKAIEYILDKEHEDIFTIYYPYGTIKYIKKHYKKNHFVYNFIKNL